MKSCVRESVGFGDTDKQAKDRKTKTHLIDLLPEVRSKIRGAGRTQVHNAPAWKLEVDEEFCFAPCAVIGFLRPLSSS
jgi:hypothetical protein